LLRALFDRLAGTVTLVSRLRRLLEFLGGDLKTVFGRRQVVFEQLTTTIDRLEFGFARFA